MSVKRYALIHNLETPEHLVSSMREFNDGPLAGKWVAYEDYEELQKKLELWKDISTQNGVACNERAKDNQDLENKMEEMRKYFLAFCERLIDEKNEQYRLWVNERAKAIRLEDQAKSYKKRLEDCEDKFSEETNRLAIEVQKLQAELLSQAFMNRSSFLMRKIVTDTDKYVIKDDSNEQQ